MSIDEIEKILNDVMQEDDITDPKSWQDQESGHHVLMTKLSLINSWKRLQLMGFDPPDLSLPEMDFEDIVNNEIWLTEIGPLSCELFEGMARSCGWTILESAYGEVIEPLNEPVEKIINSLIDIFPGDDEEIAAMTTFYFNRRLGRFLEAASHDEHIRSSRIHLLVMRILDACLLSPSLIVPYIYFELNGLNNGHWIEFFFQYQIEDTGEWLEKDYSYLPCRSVYLGILQLLLDHAQAQFNFQGMVA